MKKILMLNASPKKDGNTALLVEWFKEGALGEGAFVEVVHVASLKYRSLGCASCRACQKRKEYECVIKDDAQAVLKRMAQVDVIVMATPLYFFAPSAQLKLIFDRMFSLYKWDNVKGTMESVLTGKTFVLLASAYENIGLDALEKPFALTAEYTGMRFASLLVPNAGVSGQIKKASGIRERARSFGRKVVQGS